MADFNIAAFLTLVIVTTYTPGPNNISSASMGVLHGYRRTLSYILGIFTGFFLIMLVCGLVSTLLLRILPSFEVVLRIVGAVYILWLAYHTLKTSYNFQAKDQSALKFWNGLLLQLFNPKVILYGLTIFSTFLAFTAKQPAILILFALFLASNSFASTSLWALFGSVIRKYLRQPRVQQMVNLILALLLVYTAIEISGLLG
jgi:cysteine/O-acetylserine efflux protein